MNINKPETAIILLNWNGYKDTISCIKSLTNLPIRPCLIVVDNDSTDNSFSILKDYLGENYQQLGYSSFCAQGELDELIAEKEDVGSFACLIQSGKNGGFAFGNNVGLNFALRFDHISYFWLLNSDTELQGDALSPMIKEFDVDSSKGIVGSLLVYMHDKFTIQAVGGVKFYPILARGSQLGNGLTINDRGLHKLIPLADYISGASMLVSRKFLETVGNMNEEYFLYYEELDWSYRARKHGFTLGIALDSIVFHKEGAAIGTSSLSNRSLLSEYYLARNLILWYWRFIPWLVPVAILRNIRECFNYIKSRDFARIKIILGATCAGIAFKNNRSSNF